jgi:hypothetical protein
MKKGRSETMFAYQHIAATTDANHDRNSWWPAAAAGNGSVSTIVVGEDDSVTVSGVLRSLLS